MVFCDNMFCSVLWHFIDKIFDGKQNFKNRRTLITSASPQLRTRKKNPKLGEKEVEFRFFITSRRYLSLLNKAL